MARSDYTPLYDKTLRTPFQRSLSPVKGAAVYYMRYVPHHWSQDVCVNICTQLRKAMKPGYSKLLVNEWTISGDNPSMFITSIDLSRMVATGGMERTEKLHRYYLEKAGLTVTGIFGPGDNVSESVLEAMLIEWNLFNQLRKDNGFNGVPCSGHLSLDILVLRLQLEKLLMDAWCYDGPTAALLIGVHHDKK